MKNKLIVINKIILIIKEKIPRFSKYTLVGFINLNLTLLIYYILISFFYVNYLTALIFMWVFGLLFTYTFNFIWTFKPEKKLNYGIRLLKYFLVYFTSFSINYLLLKNIRENYISDSLLAQLLIIPLIVLINFSGIKYWALRPKISIQTSKNIPE